MAVSNRQGVLVDLVSTHPPCTPITRGGRWPPTVGIGPDARSPQHLSVQHHWRSDQWTVHCATLHPARPVCILCVCLFCVPVSRDAMCTYVATRYLTTLILMHDGGVHGVNLDIHTGILCLSVSLCLSPSLSLCVCVCVCVCVSRRCAYQCAAWVL